MSLERLVAGNMIEALSNLEGRLIRNVSDGAFAKQNAASNKIRMDCFVTFVPRNDVLLAANYVLPIAYYFLFFTIHRMNSVIEARARARTMEQPMKAW